MHFQSHKAQTDNKTNCEFFFATTDVRFCKNFVRTGILLIVSLSIEYYHQTTPADKFVDYDKETNSDYTSNISRLRTSSVRALGFII